MLLNVYLLVNSLLYLLLSVWCFAQPKGTANFLGLDFLNNSGKAEYLAVYAGLEMGFAIFFALAAFYPSLKLPALVLCACMYGGAMLARTSGALYSGNISSVTYMMGGLEYVLGISGAILLFLEYKKA